MDNFARKERCIREIGSVQNAVPIFMNYHLSQTQQDLAVFYAEIVIAKE
jgi:hypothetical protein